ncbi:MULTISPECIES: ATP-binding protein [unclassified Streptomyces]|uniref:ATP-binding protein n=1 Tax=unclassified Streptomyces TaxID=2593676 RepID=UPI003D934F2E
MIRDDESTCTQWEMWLTPFPRIVGQARRGARAALTGWDVPAGVVDTTELIVSELVTNAIRHCDTQHLVHLRVSDDGATLLVEVADPNARHPRPAVPALDAEGGRGLMLVRAVAAEFGARDRQPVGKTVWAAVSRLPAE